MLYPDELRAPGQFNPSVKLGRGSRIRTCDPLVPNQMRYQAALCPDHFLTVPAKRRNYMQTYRSNQALTEFFLLLPRN